MKHMGIEEAQKKITNSTTWIESRVAAIIGDCILVLAVFEVVYISNIYERFAVQTISFRSMVQVEFALVFTACLVQIGMLIRAKKMKSVRLWLSVPVASILLLLAFAVFQI